MRATRVRYAMVALALVVNLICYTDRSCISIAGPKMREEFGFSQTEMGFVYSIFSLSYFLGQTPWGMLADRYGARWLVTLAILGWSMFTGFTALAWSFGSLLAIRFVFGGLEAALSPAVATAFRHWVPDNERSSAFGFFLGGGRLGAAITPLIAASILAAAGWRAMFVAFGGLGVVTAVAWMFWFRNTPAEHRSVNAAERELIRRGRAEVGLVTATGAGPRWGELLASGRLWCLLAVAFGCTFLWQFYITWFPTYLREERRMGLQESAVYAGLPFLFGVFGTWVGGLLTDALARRFGVRRARTMIGTASLTAGGLLLSAGIWCSEPKLAAVLMASGALGVDLFLGAAWASALDIGGESGGAVAGLMNAASNFAGFVSPAFNGWVLETWQDWNIFLFVAIAANWIAALLWLRVNPQPRAQGAETRVGA
jgi:MFS family permease